MLTIKIMMRVHLKLVIALLGIYCTFGASGQNARIKIDPDRKIGEISPLIYGNFVEHLGRCVYGGIYDPNSDLADEDGLRKDVIEATKDLNISIIRYPGGNFVSNYHWEDGVGPDRIPRMELAWQRLETNQFGTNEFVKFTRKVGAEPYFAVNMGTGTIEEARRWVEYSNVKEGPYYAELRKKHGYPEPHNIKYWSLGNEMDGHWQMGHLNVEDYTKKAREAAKLMRMTSPGIEIIAAGSSNYGSDADPDHWNATVLSVLKNHIDYIALHLYLGNPDDDYYGYMSTPMVMNLRTQVVRGMILREMQDANRGNRGPIHIAWDEWNVWYRATGGNAVVGERALEERYNLEDALVVAGMLNVFIRNADIVKIANMAQLVNVIAPMFTNEKGIFRQTIYYPFQLFSTHMRGSALDIFVKTDTYNTGEFRRNAWDSRDNQQNVPYLDVSAALNNDEVVIAVVNRHKDMAINTEITLQEGSFAGNIRVFEINGPDLKMKNDFDGERVKTVEKNALNVNGRNFTYSFPAHSLTMLKAKLN
jgi:alpha-N-arabinofuranosidase